MMLTMVWLLPLVQICSSFVSANPGTATKIPRHTAVKSQGDDENRRVAVGLLRLGTACFPAANLVLAATTSTEVVAQVFVAYAATVLAYIGGLQQSVAVSSDSMSSGRVAGAIALALASGCATVYGFLGDARLALAAVAGLYAIQLVFVESATSSSPSDDYLFLNPERRWPMRIAICTLGLASLQLT